MAFQRADEGCRRWRELAPAARRAAGRWAGGGCPKNGRIDGKRSPKGPLLALRIVDGTEAASPVKGRQRANRRIEGALTSP